MRYSFALPPVNAGKVTAFFLAPLKLCQSRAFDKKKFSCLTACVEREKESPIDGGTKMIVVPKEYKSL